MTMINSVGVSVTASAQSAENRLLLRDVARDDLRREGYNIPNTSRVYNKLDEFLNLGNSRDLNMSDLSPQEREIFLKMLSSLLKHGVIGYNVYEVNGRAEKHYVVNTIGDSRLYGKKLVKE